MCTSNSTYAFRNRLSPSWQILFIINSTKIHTLDLGSIYFVIPVYQYCLPFSSPYNPYIYSLLALYNNLDYPQLLYPHINFCILKNMVVSEIHHTSLVIFIIILKIHCLVHIRVLKLDYKH